MELSLVENIQREDLNPVEEAEGYRSLLTNCYLTQEEVAQRVGKDRSTIANMVRLLQLPLELQDLLRQGELQMGHARALLSLEDDEDRLALGRRCVAERMTVRDLEKAVKARRSGRGRPGPSAAGRERRDPHLVHSEEQLQQRYGTAVHIHRSAKKGQIAIEFYDDGDLERILELLLEDRG
jgi:ParB family chromosome partitioning protein